MNQAKLKRLKRLSSLFRQGRIDDSQILELVKLETWWASMAPKAAVINTIYDLPVAKAFWEADVRNMGW